MPNQEQEKPGIETAAATVGIDPALIWLVDDVVANAAVIIVIATEHLLGPEALEGFQAIKVAGFAAPERTATVAFAAVGTIIVFA